MATNIIVPQFKAGESDEAWFDRALRQGNFLHTYLARERARTGQRMARTAQKYRNYQRRKGSEFELISVMDPRTFMRWHQTDPGILTDKGEFKKLVRDNREMTPWKA